MMREPEMNIRQETVSLSPMFMPTGKAMMATMSA